jgi:hypothetical protein
MNREQAGKAAATFQAAGWDVVAQRSPLGYHELVGRAHDGGVLYGFSHNDMKTLIVGGQIRKLT